MAAPIQAQNPTAEMRLTNATGSPGLPVVVRALLDHDMDCEAFSFGVSHDPALLTMTSLERGIHLEDATLGGVSPDYLMMDMEPIGGGGFIVGCLFDLIPPITDLVAGTDRELIIATYDVNPNAAGTTQLQFSANLHTPAVEILVVMAGIEVIPVTSTANIVFITCL